MNLFSFFAKIHVVYYIRFEVSHLKKYKKIYDLKSAIDERIHKVIIILHFVAVDSVVLAFLGGASNKEVNGEVDLRVNMIWIYNNLAVLCSLVSGRSIFVTPCFTIKSTNSSFFKLPSDPIARLWWYAE